MSAKEMKEVIVLLVSLAVAVFGHHRGGLA
jgi:hypothetical protein